MYGRLYNLNTEVGVVTYDNLKGIIRMANMKCCFPRPEYSPPYN